MLTGTTPKRCMNWPPVGNMYILRPFRSLRWRIGLVVAKLHGSQLPWLSQVTPSISP